jgi:adenylate cyclase
MPLPTGTITFLFTDVEGSTRLWEESPVAMKTALARHDAIVRHALESHDGYIFATGGDAFSAAFQSVSDALDAALSAQRMLQAEPWRGVDIRVRMAIHTGEPEERDGDYFGPTLNRAARILSTAVGSEVLVSNSVAALAGTALPLGAELIDVGERELKDIEGSEHVFRVAAPGLAELDRLDGDETAAWTATSFAPSDRLRRSIAVLPFDVIGGDDDTAALADGLVDDIITALSAYRHFPVTARTSTFAYREKALDIRQIASELSVRFVLEGSVRRSGSKLRVTAQLVDGVDGNQVWAERYDGEFDDVFEFQDRITPSVAAAIDPAIVLSEARRLGSKPPGSFDAWDHFARGRPLIESLHKAEGEEGIRHLQQAIELDPDFAGAHATLAFGYFISVWLNWTEEPEAELDRALAEARRALQIDSMNALAHVSAGAVWFWRRQFDRARTAAQRALALNPSLPTTHNLWAVIETYAGDPAKGLDHSERGLELDPFGYFSAPLLAVRSLCHHLLGAHETAVEEAREAIARRSGYVFARIVLTASLARLGRIEEARATLDEIRQIMPDFTPASINQPFRPEDLAFVVEGLRLAGLETEG